MPYVKGTFMFRYRDSGWSERYWLDTPSITAAETIYSDLALRRMKLAASGVQLAAIRLSIFAERRNATLIPIPAGAANGSFEAGSGVLAVVNSKNDALFIRLRTSVLRYTGRIFFRGIGDNLVADDTFTASANWITFFSSTGGYKEKLLGEAFMIRGRPVPPAGGSVFTRITSVDVVGPTTHRVGRPFGLPVGRRRTRASA